jgi:hypothetical protein
VARSRVRRTVWLVVLSVLAMTIAGLLGAVVRQSYVTNTAAADVVRLEEMGADFLHPMTTLIGELVAARSVAVRGGSVDAASVRRALAEVAQTDETYGDRLKTTVRLTELTGQVSVALGQGASGRAAFETYSGLITLAVKLQRHIGDVSHLVHDPDLDSYYLMEAAVIRLPEAMIQAGNASDLVAIAGGKLTGEDAVKAAVARYGVSAAAEAVTEGLRKSVEITTRSELGGNVAERLDAFKAAADDFAPPTMLGILSGGVAPEVLAANANRVFAAANPLAHQLLSELQALLEKRRATLAAHWRFTATAAGSAALLGVAVVWLLGFVRPGLAREADDGGKDEDPSIGSFAYAREMLASEELVKVGRAVHTRGRGDAR